MNSRTIAIASVFGVVLLATVWMLTRTSPAHQADSRYVNNGPQDYDPLAGIPEDRLEQLPALYLEKHAPDKPVVRPRTPSRNGVNPFEPPEYDEPDPTSAGGGGNATPPNKIPKRGYGFVYVGSARLQYGSPRLVRLVKGVSKRMIKILYELYKFRVIAGSTRPDLEFRPVLEIDDGNTRDGAPAAGHLSHSKGHSVDIGYFYQTPHAEGGVPYNAVRSAKELDTVMVEETVERHGEKVTWPKRYLRSYADNWDLENNWAFILALIDSKEARVTQIIVDPSYYGVIKTWARKELKGARLAHLLQILKPDGNHDTHMHIQIAP